MAEVLTKDYKVYIDRISFKQKPSNKDAGLISNRISQSIKRATPQEIAELVGNQGKSILTAVMEGGRGNKNFVEQSVYAIDFDNDTFLLDDEGQRVKDEKGKFIKVKTEGENYSSLSGILEHEFVKNNASFAYKTFSYKEDWEKFRVVFFFNRLIRDKSELAGLHKYLSSIFPNIDPSTKDPARLFYGGTEAIEINYSNVLNIDAIDLVEDRPFTMTLSPREVSPQVIPTNFDEMVEQYIELDSDNLVTEENWVSVLYSLINSVYTGELSQEQAEKYCGKLAMGDSEWAYKNINRFRYELERKFIPESKWTFVNKVNAVVGKTDEVSIEFNSLEELKQRLRVAGDEWRTKNEKVNEKTGEVKTIPVSSRAVADIMLKHCKCVLIDEDDPELSPLAIYDPSEGIYKKGDRFIFNLAMHIERNLIESQCKQVKHFLTNDDRTQEVDRTLDSNLVVCNNGVYDRKQKELLPFSSDWIFINKISTNYVEQAQKPIYEDWDFTQWIKDISGGQQDKELLLYQMFYSAINANYVSEVAFFLYSREGRTGKGTLQELLRNLVGNRNTSNLKIKEFEKDFKISTIYGKSLILGDDNNPKDYNESSENFKSVVTGDGILLNGKFEKPFNSKLTPTVIQSMNGLPRFADTTDGFTRRLRIIEFTRSYKGSANNRNVKEKYVKDHRLHEYILSTVIDMDVYDVVDTEESQRFVNDLVLDNNPVAAFYEDVFTTLRSERLPTKFLFMYFQVWCISENNPTKIKQRNFTKQLKEIVELKGWEYSQRGMRPLEYWKPIDIEAYDELRSSSGSYAGHFDAPSERNRQQPLFSKDG